MCVREDGEEVILFSGESVCVCAPVRVNRLSDRWFLNTTDTKNSECKGLETRECSTGKRGPHGCKGACSAQKSWR